ncbi:MAG: GntR family transcriptional regulator, carbon starvation induced regulator [Pseudomonadota bacterium]|nr:GntR family transcriptional regulator, carbon starvation induced regulator [Pseudomonadota bacterium]
MQDVKKETMASCCVNKICNLIIEGKLLPGEKIKGDYIKNLLAVGLSPIREALSRLVNTGLVESIDNVGFRVAHITRNGLYDYYKSYAKIEVLIFKEAIECGREDWESNIVAALYRLSKIEKPEIKVSYEVWAVQNEDFHQALISGCPLNGLKNIRDNFMLLKEWYNNLAYGHLKGDLINVNHSEHSKIVKLALDRKIDSACSLLYQHTMHGLESLVLSLERLGYIV